MIDPTGPRNAARGQLTIDDVRRAWESGDAAARAELAELIATGVQWFGKALGESVTVYLDGVRGAFEILGRGMALATRQMRESAPVFRRLAALAERANRPPAPRRPAPHLSRPAPAPHVRGYRQRRRRR